MPTHRQNTGSPISRFFKSLYLSNRFFIALLACAIGFTLCFIFGGFFLAMEVILGALLLVFIIDAISIYRLKQGVIAHRICPDRLSNGDENKISIYVNNRYPMSLAMEIVEELPFEFQKRDLIYNSSLIPAGGDTFFHYNIRPVKRGVYLFGDVNIYVSSVFGLLKRRYIFYNRQQVAVYPSFIEMHKYELLAASHRLTDYGVRKIRKIGQATEFDHIKHYVMGDDPRTINYKATARTNQLMVNTYQEEKSQQVYCLIDKGRTMQMPFNNMTLLDYAINSTLMVCSTALNRSDKAGLITFSSGIDDVLPADRQQGQKNKILEVLYGQRTKFQETDYEKLYIMVKRKLNQRSLIILYTNFETLNGMRRQLKYLSRMAKDHLVLVAFFSNTEFKDVLDSSPKDMEDIFRKGIAEKLAYDKELIVKELNRHGVHSILSKPESLTIDSINKYLEFKARGLI